tara:strand:- start:444 stop:632 length:189 start_codon:yes stop_codon:yes gene_type:complete
LNTAYWQRFSPLKPVFGVGNGDKAFTEESADAVRAIPSVAATIGSITMAGMQANRLHRWWLF